MKKIYSLVTVLLLACSTGFGQVEIKLWDTGTQAGVGNNLNGQEYTYYASASGLHHVTLNFKNTSASTKTWKVERYRLDDEATWSDYLCWGIAGDPNGMCYSAQLMSTNPWTSPNAYSLTVAPNGTANLVAYTDQVTASGTEKYRFYLIEGQSTRVDSVDVTLTSVLAVGDQKQEEIGVSIYPNPVSNVLTVNATGVEGSVELKMVDVLGKVVLAESGAPLNKVDVSNFKNGVYLVHVYNKGSLIQTKRIVVKH